MSLIKKFWEVPLNQKTLVAEAICFLLASKLLLLIFPFRICKQIFRKNERLDRQPSPQTLKDIRTAVERANKIAIWKNVCLVKSFAARLMLQRRGIPSSIYLGVNITNETKLAAHAWLISGGVYITPRGSVSFKEIYNF
ncbi:lasso peptide biosynthesis B2 protein [Alistipes sp. ZOR0009]|uniref:lasso peptide biosynthesis B2 protein n=1 Tax=Alistipes sp. ZOR0009 TaxID=1339253 RepID=UPI00068CA4D3|nr:lasso peptide biosynthesis B2 protein [Alistipes sp. ZOR0009]